MILDWSANEGLCRLSHEILFHRTFTRDKTKNILNNVLIHVVPDETFSSQYPDPRSNLFIMTDVFRYLWSFLFLYHVFLVFFSILCFCKIYKIFTYEDVVYSTFMAIVCITPRKTIFLTIYGATDRPNLNYL